MHTAAGSKVASPCWVCAKSITLPPGRTASIAAPNQRIAAHGQNHGIRAAPFRRLQYALDYVFSLRVDGLMQPEPGRNGVALGIKVGGEHACSACGERAPPASPRWGPGR